jgi:hypothetical protein
MIQKPNTQPVEVHALTPWNCGTIGAIIEGQIIGTVETQMGFHYVLEVQSGERFRLPNHVDLDRKIQAVRMIESNPYLVVKFTGHEEDGKTRIYLVQHYPRK